MKKVEFLIIGQGLAGTMLAFEMLKVGSTFKIVSSPNKSKTSLVAAGMVNPLVFKRLTKSWMIEDLLPVMKSTYRELEELLNTQFYFEKEILKPLSEQEKPFWLERKKHPEIASFIGEIATNSPIEYLQKSAAYAQVTNSGYLNLTDFLQKAESFFREKNLFSEAEFDFPAFAKGNSTIQVANIEASKIVFCEGYHLMHNPLFNFIKMRPVKGEILQIHSPKLSEDFILNKQVFVLPVGNHRFKVGSTYEWKDLSEKPSELGKSTIIERLDKLIFADYKIENHWAGVRPAVIDRRPILGQHPEDKRLFVFNGLGTKGVMLVPYFAKEMVQYLSETNFNLSKEVDVQRFVKK